MTVTLVLALSLILISFVSAHAAILAQFIGADDRQLQWLAIVQIISVGVSLSLLCLSIYAGSNFPWSKQKTWRSNLRTIWNLLPSWLIFITSLLLVNVLLGEVAIRIARWQGHHVSMLQHVPTLSISLVCVAATLVFLIVSASE